MQGDLSYKISFPAAYILYIFLSFFHQKLQYIILFFWRTQIKWSKRNLLIIRPVSTFPVFVSQRIMICSATHLITEKKPAQLLTIWTTNELIAMKLFGAAKDHICWMFVVWYQNSLWESNLLIVNDNPNVFLPILNPFPSTVFLESIGSQIHCSSQ